MFCFVTSGDGVDNCLQLCTYYYYRTINEGLEDSIGLMGF